MHSNILLDEQPLVVLPKLAVFLGLNEAIVLQQLHYWLRKNPKFRDNRNWIYNSLEQWHEQFPFWSTDTIKRTISKLVDSKIVIKDYYNKSSFDRTLWYSIDYEVLDKKVIEKFGLESAKCISADCPNGEGQDALIPLVQNAQMEEGKMPQSNTETTSETIPKTSQTDIKGESKKSRSVDMFDTLIADYTSNPDLIKSIREFIKMRVSIKKSPTNMAMELILVKLDKMTSSDEEKIEILNNSIVNNWQDIYALKKPPPDFVSSNNQSPLEQLGDFFKNE